MSQSLAELLSFSPDHSSAYPRNFLLNSCNTLFGITENLKLTTFIYTFIYTIYIYINDTVIYVYIYIILYLYIYIYIYTYIHRYIYIWRRPWHPIPVLLPGKSHGRRSLVGCSPCGCEELDMTEQLPFHFSLSCIGEANGNPLQCSCLENPRDGGAWWVAIYGVAQSQT